MKKSLLKFDQAPNNTWHSIFRNNHGRKVYLRVKLLNNNLVTICDCFYIDRPIVSGKRSMPIKQKTKQCHYDNLLNVLASEVDKRFYSIEFSDNNPIFSTEEYIKHLLKNKYKHKFLILVESNGYLKTRIKNRVHRTIYLEVKKDIDKALIYNCFYCDRHYKCDNTLITPPGLTTIYFDYSCNAVLKIINEELNCDFTDIIITQDTFGFDRTELPICGSI